MTPKRFLLCFENHRPDGMVWAVKVGRSWQLAGEVFVNVPVQTVYRGRGARQPTAYLVGRGIVRGTGDRLTIEAA